MFIRQTKTSTALSGETYYTFRLVASERIGGKVRQRTLLNLGRNFSMPREQWPQLCARIEQILSGQMTLLPAPPAIEKAAQRYAARLITVQRPTPQENEQKTIEYHEVDIDSLELTRPRSIGVEHVGLAALNWLGFPQILESVGFNGVQQGLALAAIIGRMASPGSELATWRWLTAQSGLGELLEIDYDALVPARLYRISDQLVRQRDAIESALFSRITDLFSLPTTVTLYDLTNTYFEGEMANNAKAKRGHSKEKRSDCPLVTLGLVLDGSGFVRRSRVFEGSVAEASTLETMLSGLGAPPEALVIMDRGIATQANIDWLVAHHYRYLVVSRERLRQFPDASAVTVSSAAGQEIQLQRVVSDDGREVRLYCHSAARGDKEKGITTRFSKRFEEGLARIAAALAKPRGEKRRDKVLERIGRLKEKCRGIGQHYRITLSPEAGTLVTGLSWEKEPVAGTQLTHPGVYCLRTNELRWDDATLWQTYTTLTDLEAVFRSLKSELGLRPVYHQTEARVEGHLFITVLAYQAVQVLRRKLKDHGITASWTTLREIFAVQQRVTASFTQRDGRTLHVRKTTVAEPELRSLYEALNLPASPMGTRKLLN